jgi:hypothetical protein
VLAGAALRAPSREAVFILIPVVLAPALMLYPSIPLMAIGLWWTANTSAHHFIHRPFFRARSANAVFSLLLTGVMGVPQDVWRARHLAHHAHRPWRFRLTAQLAAEAGLLVAMWVTLAALDPELLATVYMPGWGAGLGLCAIQGHYEHAGGATTSHYGRLYNVLCFNDGYHAEHHAAPGLDWATLPQRIALDARSSRWPPLLRWLDAANLDTLERLVLQSRVLQWIVVRCHRRAFERLLPHLPPIRHVAIVGGGLFPRTALVLRELLPAARLLIIDANADHIESARARVGANVELELRRYPRPGELEAANPYDLLVIPLAFDGDREAIYRRRPARALIVHDWLWRPRGTSRVVSFALLKRINLLTGRA